jgi:pyruvate formate lyase activating enzyme
VEKALLWKKLARTKTVQCRLCDHYCKIPESGFGICRARQNLKGALHSLNYGKVEGLAIDPIEKKPFFHFHPGARVLSFGAPGCNFRCLGCQNWELSQGPKLSKTFWTEASRASPKKIAEEAFAAKCDGIAYTYSEPTVFFEYARDCALEARKIDKNLFNVFVTNGYFSKEAFSRIKKERLLDAIRIDLKFMDDANYGEYCGGKLAPVLRNIRAVAKSKIHLEIIVLVIPTLNDSPEKLREFSKFVAGVNKSIPVHFLKFHPDYEAMNLPATPDETLLLARKIAKEEGIEYAYLGNSLIPGGEDTLCPGCGDILIQRSGFGVLKNFLEEPVCPGCGRKLNIVL